MTRGAALIAVAFGALAVVVVARVRAANASDIDPFEIGGRFTFTVLLDEDERPFPWNSATHSASDRTRLMLDLKAEKTRYGSLYLKGAAVWGEVRAEDVSKRLRFEQGDYLWDQALESLTYSFRLFANERRFFTYDRIAPLIDDDRVNTARGNLGLRFDARVGPGVELTVLHSALDDDPGDGRALSYARALVGTRAGALSASYLFEDPAANFVRNRAVVKTEFSTAYRRLTAVVSYLQSGLEFSTLFFPGGRWHWSEYEGDNFSHVLPRSGAAFGELRFGRVSAGRAGDLQLVWRYAAMREEFIGDTGIAEGPSVGHTSSLYYWARDVGLNARIRYHTSERSVLESEKRRVLDGSVWGRLANGMDFFVRGLLSRVEDRLPFDTRSNFVHAALHHRIKKLSAGVHVMWRDIDTIFSSRRFGIDGKYALSPNWGVHWRFLASDGDRFSQMAFGRLEYRPSNRVYATFHIGREVVGDEPFLLEDVDIALPVAGSTVYGFSLRGDF